MLSSLVCVCLVVVAVITVMAFVWSKHSSGETLSQKELNRQQFFLFHRKCGTNKANQQSHL